MPGSEWEAPVSSIDSDSESSSVDWEDSIDSSELDFETTESETDDDEMLAEYLPKLSKYFVTY